MLLVLTIHRTGCVYFIELDKSASTAGWLVYWYGTWAICYHSLVTVNVRIDEMFDSCTCVVHVNSANLLLTSANSIGLRIDQMTTGTL